MLARLRKAFERRRKAARQAEALIYHAGFAGVGIANAAADNSNLDDEGRLYQREVARIAGKRARMLLSVEDAATVSAIQDRWARRPGQMIY